jgi:hypothetical protein
VIIHFHKLIFFDFVDELLLKNRAAVDVQGVLRETFFCSYCKYYFCLTLETSGDISLVACCSWYSGMLMFMLLYYCDIKFFPL